MMTAIVPVVLCGGSGSRLWPLSRRAYPKQFLALTGSGTMLQETLGRVPAREGFAPPVLICGEAHRFIAAAQVQEAGVSPDAVLLEPEARNTAPAIAAAALHLAARDPRALMLVLAADHHIEDAGAFRAAVAGAVPAAREGALVTFGIQPTRPETGYGYIRRGAAREDGLFTVDAFVEKPDAATARGWLDGSAHYWNAGLFLFRADRYLAELEAARPAIVSAVRGAMAGARADLDFLRLEAEAFAACPSESIDYAVMETTASALVAPLDAGWSDIGSWAALADIGTGDATTDAAGNVTRGDTMLEGCAGSYIRAEEGLVAAIGLRDMIVVRTRDTVLVAPRDRAQDVRVLVDRLREEGRDEYDHHPRVHRPWGYYESIHRGERHQVKHIRVNPGATLSLQMHHHRAEHWVVVRGTALVTRGAEEQLLSENESIYIPLGATHRLANPGRVPLSLVEVQSGAYLGEDDIVRFEDQYNRS